LRFNRDAKLEQVGPVDRTGAVHAWPAARIEWWPTDKLVPFAYNARKHSEADVELLAAMIKKYGWTAPALVDEEGSIIAGHLRALAAEKLDLEFVPVVVARGWTKTEKRAFCIADNQVAARASWDFDILRIELGDLKIGGFDVDLIGFDSDTLTALLSSGGGDGLTDPDDVPKVAQKVVTEPEDTWVLDGHRVRCGDSTNPTDVEALMGSVAPELLIGDPPYGVRYKPAWRDSAGLARGKRSRGKVSNDDRTDWQAAWALYSGDVGYVWHDGRKSHVVAESLKACGFEIRSQIIWVKQHFVLSRGEYHWGHEPCFYVVREGAKSHWTGDHRQSTVWQIANNNAFGNQKREQAFGHGTQRPVELMRRPILNNSRPGAIIYDPFLGSGTTIIAAQMTGRLCYGLELNPAYVDVVVRRWQEFSGHNAIHEKTGQGFNDRAADDHVTDN